MNHAPLAIFLMGPTAAGKTELAIQLAQRLPCRLISVDSALIYRGMDIGTAKPSPEIQRAFPHRLIDIRDPAQSYSAADFRRDALQEMAQISAQGEIPLLVGGSMLYFRSLLSGLASMPGSDALVRAELQAQAAQLGWPQLHEELQRVDPEAAARIHPNDPQRLLRALEVYRVSGVSLSEHHRRQAQENAPVGGLLPYTVLQFAVAPVQRSLLHERIARRFQQMLEQGFVAEVQRLRARADLNEGLPAMRAVGYRQIWQFLEGRCTAAQMQARAVAATRQLAKRQLTWLRRWDGLFWLDAQAPDNWEQAVQYLQQFPAAT